jgi:hypothetical protein
VKYIPQKLLEHLCSNVDSNEFKAGTRKNNFLAYSAGQQLGYDTLEDLIDHHSELITEQVSKKRYELSVHNQEIEKIGKVKSKANRSSIEGILKLKKVSRLR